MRPTRKIGNLLRSFIWRDRSSMANSSRRMFKNPPAFTRWTPVRVLAMGALVLVGAAVYFNAASEGTASTPGTQQSLDARSARVGDVYRGSPIDDDAWRFDSPYYEDFSAEVSPGPSSAPVQDYIPDDAWRFNSPFYDDFRDGEESSPSYHQQRATDSIQERLEVLQD